MEGMNEIEIHDVKDTKNKKRKLEKKYICESYCLCVILLGTL